MKYISFVKIGKMRFFDKAFHSEYAFIIMSNNICVQFSLAKLLTMTIYKQLDR